MLMHLTLATYILIAGSLLSCNSGKKDPATTLEPVNKIKVAPMHCYQYSGNGDTITLKIIPVNDAITGILIYHLKEKDRNRGTIQGRMKGDILLAEYSIAAILRAIEHLFYH